jgi:hypothetical protein
VIDVDFIRWENSGITKKYLNLKETARAMYRLAIVLLFPLSVFAQDYKFHSVFIYNFTKYVEWPDSYKSGDFVIGVLGSTSLTDYLDAMAKTKTVGSQPLKVSKFANSGAIGKCHILFIPVDQSDKFEEVKSKLNGKPTLIITEKEGLAASGSGINFVQIDGRWKFELNEAAINAQNLKVSGELKRLAILI